MSLVGALSALHTHWQVKVHQQFFPEKQDAVCTAGCRSGCGQLALTLLP